MIKVFLNAHNTCYNIGYYSLYFKRINRDDADYNSFVFAKPTDKEIARSRAMAQLSDKDKARCQAFAELEEEYMPMA